MGRPASCLRRKPAALGDCQGVILVLRRGVRLLVRLFIALKNMAPAWG